VHLMLMEARGEFVGLIQNDLTYTQKGPGNRSVVINRLAV
jgi:hypothetical protein